MNLSKINFGQMHVFITVKLFIKKIRRATVLQVIKNDNAWSDPTHSNKSSLIQRKRYW